MKTLGIVAAVITSIGILSWIVFQTLKTDNSESSYNMHPSNFEKPEVEKTIDFDQLDKYKDDTLDLTGDREQ